VAAKEVPEVRKVVLLEEGGLADLPEVRRVKVDLPECLRVVRKVAHPVDRSRAVPE
jgi:hypothetical protein